ncbi:peptidase family M1-domain-containing protein [Hyaloraphidium curvatum]|nr:peptidase family M1-domain-containing protein [Hyaloraphidium curvatum]
MASAPDALERGLLHSIKKRADAADTGPRRRAAAWRWLPPLLLAGAFLRPALPAAVWLLGRGQLHSAGSVSPPDLPGAPPYSFPLVGAPADAAWDNFRLPPHVRPDWYRIELVTELEWRDAADRGRAGQDPLDGPEDEFSFRGVVEMDFHVDNETDFLVLNYADMELGAAEIAERNRTESAGDESSLSLIPPVGSDPRPAGDDHGRRPPAKTFHPVPLNISMHTNEQLFLRLSSPRFKPEPGLPATMVPGRGYTLRLPFRGKLEESLLGYYRSSYEERGETRWLSSTQFESTDARRAFPCLDEPIFKAAFSLVSHTRHRFRTLFNMPLLREGEGGAPTWSSGMKEREGSWRTAEFGSTPAMSSYLVAYVVSAFESVSSTVYMPLYAPEPVDSSNDSPAEQGSTKPVRISIFFPPGQAHTASLSLRVAMACLPFYSRLYRIPYPLPKLDLIAIPDFASGAMENWGLVTFRSTSLLYDPVRSSTQDKQTVAATVAHELAHLWTGDLVTMRWWDDLWLNEGFAQYVENLGAEEYGLSENENWRMEEQFFGGEEESSLWEDAGRWTHAVVNKNLKTPGEIEEAFDAITYSKGSSLIRMLRAWVNEARKNVTNPPPPTEDRVPAQRTLVLPGSDALVASPAPLSYSPVQPDPYHPDYFFRRMHSYLSTYAYGTATTADLWAKLDLHHHNHSEKHPPHNHTGDAPVFGVGRTMSTWTEQEGFPVVIMTPLPDGSLHLRQERYFHSHCCQDPSLPADNTTWWIPFSYQVYTNASEGGIPVPVGQPQTVLMKEREMVLSGIGHCNDWQAGCDMKLVKANFRQTAFYRVQYPPGDIRVFADWIEKSFFLPPVGRAGLLSDAISMSLSGRSDDIESTLILFDKLLRPLLAEEDLVVWSVTIASIQRAFFHGAFEVHPSYGLVKKWLQLLCRPAIKQVGWDEERRDPHVRRLLRTMLLRFAVAIGEHGTVKRAKHLFDSIASGEVAVRKELKQWEVESGAGYTPEELAKPAVTPDVLDVIYDSAMIGGNEREHEMLQAMFHNATFATEQQRILHAMCMAKPLFLVRRNLLFVTSPAVRLQDTFRALIWITSSSYEANFETWTFFRENWEDLMRRYNIGPIGQRWARSARAL